MERISHGWIVIKSFEWNGLCVDVRTRSRSSWQVKNWVVYATWRRPRVHEQLTFGPRRRCFSVGAREFLTSHDRRPGIARITCTFDRVYLFITQTIVSSLWCSSTGGHAFPPIFSLRVTSQNPNLLTSLADFLRPFLPFLSDCKNGGQCWERGRHVNQWRDGVTKDTTDAHGTK